MTNADVLRSPNYEAYASLYLCRGGDDAATAVCWRKIRPLLPTVAGPIVDLGYGCGELFLFLQPDGSDLGHIASAAVAGSQHGHILTRDLMFAARQPAVVARSAGS